jgi:hypothetical protein
MKELYRILYRLTSIKYAYCTDMKT